MVTNYKKAKSRRRERPSSGINMRAEFTNLKEWYDRLKANRDEYKPVWSEISKYVGIRVDPNYNDHAHIDKSKVLDYLVDDPTACISVNQTGDYLQGVCWGVGDASPRS